MLFPERRYGLVNNSNLFDYLFSDPVFNTNTTNTTNTTSNTSTLNNIANATNTVTAR